MHVASKLPKQLLLEASAGSTFQRDPQAWAPGAVPVRRQHPKRGGRARRAMGVLRETTSPPSASPRDVFRQA